MAAQSDPKQQPGAGNQGKGPGQDQHQSQRPGRTPGTAPDKEVPNGGNRPNNPQGERSTQRPVTERHADEAKPDGDRNKAL